MQTRLLEELRAGLARRAVRAMTFDVFDTFLLRRCGTPQGVFERAAHHAPIAAARPGLVDSYVQHRLLAENRAHDEAKEDGGSPEIPIGRVYEHFPLRLFGLDRSAAAQLVDAEFQAELDLCFANPDVAALYAQARRLGLKTGFVSDTYWSADRLARLLRTAKPGLEWDYLYASCDHGTNKADRLFERFLGETGLTGAEVLHIGDNPIADLKGAQRFGIATIHVPQASERLAAILQREHTTTRLLTHSGVYHRQDEGLCAVRRIVAARAVNDADGYRLGLEVVGPLLTGFDRFVADRVARLSGGGGKIAVAFLARDGMLSFAVWQVARRDPAVYLEINRRVALIGAATSLEPLTKLFGGLPTIDEQTLAAMLKIKTPRLSAFFQAQPGGWCSGEDFAEAMPQLFDDREIEALAAAMRRELFTYLRHMIPDFDQLTDLVLVDLGYAGSIQKALRRAFDAEGIRARLHGLYLLSFDDCFVALADGDTAEGFVSDLVVPPRVNRLVARNATILEHACCAPQGSVLGYQDAVVLREPDPRPADQLATCTEIQTGALDFARQAGALAASDGIDPFVDLERSAGRAAAILARFLLLPTDDELGLLGSIKHDVNWGTQTLLPTADAAAADRLNVALALPALYATPEPPMWFAGTMASLSPVHAFLYALFGTGHLPGDIFADVKNGKIDVALVSAGQIRSVPASCFRTSHGDIRVRIPVTQAVAAQAVAIPLGRVAREGLITGMTIQTGATMAKAMADRLARPLPPTAWSGTGIEFSGAHYRIVQTDDHQLWVRLPVLSRKIGVLSILIKPLEPARQPAQHPAQRPHGRDARLTA